MHSPKSSFDDSDKSSSDDENDDFKDPIKSVVNRLLTQLIENKMENTQMYNTLLEHWIDMNKDLDFLYLYSYLF